MLSSIGFPGDNAFDSSGAHRVLFCQNGNRFIFLEPIPYRNAKSFPHLACVFVGKLGLAIECSVAAISKDVHRMSFIFCHGAPLKIILSVIELIPVYMIYRWAKWALLAKELCNKPMNGHVERGPISIQDDPGVAAVANSPFQDRTIAVAAKPANIPVTRDFVSKPIDLRPDFVFRNRIMCTSAHSQPETP